MTVFAVLVAHACATPSWPGGIHARLVWSANNGVRVLETPTDGPAARAGLSVGDRIVAIDGTPIAGLNAQAVHELLEGEVGTWVQVTVDRGSGWEQLRIERTPYGASP